MAKTYRQYCGLARALDIVGDRWTLLIIRQLLVSEASYGDLQRGLPGIATNLLAERLRFLEGHAIVGRSGTGKTTRYRLTGRGRELQDAVHSLVRWGAPEMARGGGGDAFDPRWLVVALGALASPSEVEILLGFAVEGTVVIVDTRNGGSRLADGTDEADVTIEAGAETALALASGLLPLGEAVASGRVKVHGSVRDAQSSLATLNRQRIGHHGAIARVSPDAWPGHTK